MWMWVMHSIIGHPTVHNHKKYRCKSSHARWNGITVLYHSLSVANHSLSVANHSTTAKKNCDKFAKNLLLLR